jgi:hypothetical protein
MRDERKSTETTRYFTHPYILEKYSTHAKERNKQRIKEKQTKTEIKAVRYI